MGMVWALFVTQGDWRGFLLSELDGGKMRGMMMIVASCKGEHITGLMKVAVVAETQGQIWTWKSLHAICTVPWSNGRT